MESQRKINSNKSLATNSVAALAAMFGGKKTESPFPMKKTTAPVVA